MDWNTAWHASDDRLPFDARAGSMLSLQTWPLRQAYGNGSLIAPPARDCNPILAISRLELNRSGVLYRYYLADGGAGVEVSFLQVLSHSRGEASEVLYCTRLARLVAETAEEQEVYTGAAGCGLGDQHYTLWRAQLSHCGYDEEDLNFAFGADDGLDYQRDAGDPASGFIAPYTGTETPLGPGAAAIGARQLYYMPYARELDGGAGKESLLIASATPHGVCGDAGRRHLLVEFVIGVPLEAAAVAIT